MVIAVTVGPKIEGVELMCSAAPEFDAAVRSLFRGNCDEVLKLRPFLAIVSNHTDRTLVAYSVKWEIVGRSVRIMHHEFPDALAPSVPRRGNELRPGEQQIVSMGVELDCGHGDAPATDEFYLSEFIGGFQKHYDAKAIEISIDAAIFDDGELIGPNNYKFDQDFGALVDATQNYYRLIVERLDGGMSVDEAFAPINAVARAFFANPMLDFQDIRKMQSRHAATEVSCWWRKYGDVAAPAIYRAALRTEPFVIRGDSSSEPVEDDPILPQVACPKCECLPSPADRWSCTCGKRWNTFTTRALCPACGHQWKETQCTRCGEVSPHEDWYFNSQ